MPYPNEHSLRLKDPSGFDSFGTTHGGKLFGGALIAPATIDVIWGHPKGGPKGAAIPQALRFPIKNWTEAEAKKWIKDNAEHGAKGAVEPATKSKGERLIHNIGVLKALKDKSQVAKLKEEFISLSQALQSAIGESFGDYYLADYSPSEVVVGSKWKENMPQADRDALYLVGYKLTSVGVTFDGELVQCRRVISYERVK